MRLINSVRAKKEKFSRTNTSREAHIEHKDLSEALQSIKNLVESNKPLDPEFAEILDKNFDDLWQ